MTRRTRREGTQQAINRRFKDAEGRTMRELECGHLQLERSGGKAPHAQFAVCKTCQQEYDRLREQRRHA